MGEATYYCKIFFDTPQEAQAALPKIKKFITEGIEAEDFWHSRRDDNYDDNTRKIFWSDFEQKFPEVSNYLRATIIQDGENEATPLFGGDCNNRLAGLLDFGTPGDDEYVDIDGNAICYAAYVWHFAAWDPWLDFVQKRYGAQRYSWVSDEDANYFDLCV